jgi:H+-transporting ATPase
MEPVSPPKPALAASGAAAGGSDSSGRPKTLNPAAIAAQLAKLGTSAQGLTTDEARKRLAKDGPNAIIAAEEPLWHKAVSYFWGPIPWMIEAAALISFLRHDWPDFFVVMGLLIYNAAVGFWQDAKAANALAALRKGLAL